MLAKWHIGSLVLVATLLSAPTAFADPIVITGGSPHLYWDGSLSSAVFTGSGFRFATDYGGGGTMGFTRGNTTNLNGNLSLSPFTHSVEGMRSITINGVTMLAHVVGDMRFRTDTFVVPSIPGGTSVNLMMPFLMTGRFFGYASSTPGAPLLFDIDLTGSGTAVSGAHANSDGSFLRTGGVTYNFEEAAPTPEPATLLLLASGAAVIGLRSRRRRET